MLEVTLSYLLIHWRHLQAALEPLKFKISKRTHQKLNYCLDHPIVNIFLSPPVDKKIQKHFRITMEKYSCFYNEFGNFNFFFLKHRKNTLGKQVSRVHLIELLISVFCYCNLILLWYFLVKNFIFRFLLLMHFLECSFVWEFFLNLSGFWVYISAFWKDI